MQELNTMRKQAFMGSAIGFGCILIGFLMFMGNPGVGMFLFIGGMVVLIVVSATIGKNFTRAYKEVVCKDVIEKIFDVEEYMPEVGFDEDFVRSTYLISTGNRYSSDDYIRGYYQGCDFMRSDVCMQDVRHSGKTTTTVTLFKGSWTVISFPKKISSYLMIREKEFLSGGRPGGIFSNAPYTEKVKFEDIDFNNRFEVYAEDEHDAFYVLTPQMIERIKELEFMEDGRMTIGIIDQKVHVLFDNGQNAMEPSLWNEVSEKDFERIEDEMRKIVQIMELLGIQSMERE